MTCFAYGQAKFGGSGICHATTIKCDGMNTACPFYKTPYEAHESNAAAMRHIADLPYHEQRSITIQYYHGEMPWQDYA